MIKLKRTTFKRRLGNYSERQTPLTFKYKANAKQFIYITEVDDLVIYTVNILRKKILVASRRWNSLKNFGVDTKAQEGD
jgi:hypothetical protein